MKDMELQKHIENAVDTTLASLNPSARECDLLIENIKGGKKSVMGKKVSAMLVLAIVLCTLTVGSLAATLLYHHIEKAMDITKEKGAFSNWTVEDKLDLINTMIEQGISLPKEKINIITDNSWSQEKKNQAATELLTEIYGDEEYISHFTMASHDWGDPFLWTLEQKEWFWETLRSKGLYTGKIKYLLPGENDLSRDQVVLFAKQAIQEAYDLSHETIQNYDADVTFFTIEGTQIAPRWLVYLGHAGAEAADYTVLLTQDGQATEDASLYVFLPEQQANQSEQNISQPPIVETPFQRRLSHTDALYISQSNGLYHFLSECPSINNEIMVETVNINKALDEYLPCPYCVLHTELWSVEDKIIYGAMYGELPSNDVISASQAEEIAKDYLLSSGVNSVEQLIPYQRYVEEDGRFYYEVFFAQLGHDIVNPIHSIVIDAENGEICKSTELKSAN